MDSEINRRKPVKWPHGKIVGAAVVDSELFGKVTEGIEAVTGIKAFLVLSVAALYFSVVSGRVRTDELVSDLQIPGSLFKEGRQVTPAVGKTVGELKAIVGLDALYADAPAGIPLEQLSEEISRGVGRLLWIGGQEAKAGELINGSVLVKPQFRVCNAAQRDDLHIYLNPLAGIGHLLIGLWLV